MSTDVVPVPVAWLRWLEHYLALSLAGDAKVPEQDVAPIVNAIRRDVLADERAGVPRQVPTPSSSPRR